jgi:L-aminopeptidase/D-esterase-like protein
VSAALDFTGLGLAVGHATDDLGVTGCTVVRGIERPFRCASALIGRATGSRELDATTPHHLVERVDAILLTGGSAYGLDAAAGVMRWMEERGRGFPVGTGVVPIVPTAVIFDLGPLGRFDARPTAAMAYGACDRATSTEIGEGSVGAGTGATVGKAAGITRAMKGGFGGAVALVGELVVGALAVVNALGDVRDAQGTIIAGARADHTGFLDSARVVTVGGAFPRPETSAMQNTTLCVVATNALLSRVELQQLARAASAALFRRITPVGTTFDGDIVFAIGPLAGRAVPVLQVESLAVTTLERAIERAVRTAIGRDGVPGLADAPAPAASG